MSDHDLAGEEFGRDPYPVYARWRESAPVWWSERLSAYVLSRYDDVRTMLRTPRVYGQSRFYEGAMVDAFGRDTMVVLEPPTHGRVRAQAADYFRPRQLEHVMEAEIEGIVRGAVEGLPARFEVGRELAEPVVMGTMTRLFGSPDADTLRRLHAPLVVYLKRARARDASEDVRRRGREAGEELVGFLRRLVGVRARRPRPDLVSHLLGAGMPEEEVCTVCALTLIGGVDTTVRGLANTLLGLLSAPGSRRGC